jgi:formiminotetrahydrofolate cyclodeaminase
MTDSDVSTGAASSFEPFLGQLAARQPTPGGGAVAGLSAALGASLLAMVANYTTGNRYADVEDEMLGYVSELEVLRTRALHAMRDDEVAFGAVGTAYGMPRETDEEKRVRSGAIQSALTGAVVPPRTVAAICGRLAEIATDLAQKGNKNLLSDVAVGAACTRAALDGAIVNVVINAAQISNERLRAELTAALAEMDALKGTLAAVYDDVRRKVSG